jgi:hypothetical protein
MREIRQSGSEGGVVGNGHPYPYTSPGQRPGYASSFNQALKGRPNRCLQGGFICTWVGG